MNSLGQHKEALGYARREMEINPEHDQWAWMNVGMCLFCLERYTEAIDALEQFKTQSKFPFFRLMLAASYAAVGRDEEARAEVASLGEASSKLSAGAGLFFRDPADRERPVRWLRRVGLTA